MMTQRLLRRFGSHYILVMMCVTRVICFIFAGMAVYYVNFTFNISLPLETQHRFEITALIVVPTAVFLTVLLALWETRELRHALWLLKRGRPVPLGLAVAAGQQAVTFPGVHAIHEAIIDPFICVVPLCVIPWLIDGVPTTMIVQIAITGFMGVVALVLTAINMFGGFAVTRRMLAMFRK